MFQFHCFSIIVVLLAAMTGCGADNGKFSYQPVSGTVTMDGEPLANATVAFVPQSSGLESGRPSTGMTDASGKFHLQSLGGENGAVVGDHVVSISTMVVDMNTQEVTAKETVPLKYNERSELTFTVPSSGTDTANFDLESKKKR
ncbi:hypothetical protein C5Y96_26690 [Blastopirellula marina]|uniref:DUF6795 domain-containing protein n=1 Tax=Blastopirellula marina TaxID=124 RepID=A0A2S8EYW8_9BACT|nr:MULTISPECIES: carboxypeptidase-like regulatory domain-containing protein [Pirellulaceae]PQO25092.1 hypothetical protein C5Y96_26690 [Blastopirellula marina]RCS40944.1 carboxypeptidase regulatory-like domain-containing protein [Bremerella cremea]